MVAKIKKRPEMISPVKSIDDVLFLLDKETEAGKESALKMINAFNTAYQDALKIGFNPETYEFKIYIKNAYAALKKIFKIFENEYSEGLLSIHTYNKKNKLKTYSPWHLLNDQISSIEHGITDEKIKLSKIMINLRDKQENISQIVAMGYDGKEGYWLVEGNFPPRSMLYSKILLSQVRNGS